MTLSDWSREYLLTLNKTSCLLLNTYCPFIIYHIPRSNVIIKRLAICRKGSLIALTLLREMWMLSGETWPSSGEQIIIFPFCNGNKRFIPLCLIFDKRKWKYIPQRQTSGHKSWFRIGRHIHETRDVNNRLFRPWWDMLWGWTNLLKSQASCNG